MTMFYTHNHKFIARPRTKQQTNRRVPWSSGPRMDQVGMNDTDLQVGWRPVCVSYGLSFLSDPWRVDPCLTMSNGWCRGLKGQRWL